jgi:hypothetical protein
MPYEVLSCWNIRDSMTFRGRAQSLQYSSFCAYQESTAKELGFVAVVLPQVPAGSGGRACRRRVLHQQHR